MNVDNLLSTYSILTTKLKSKIDEEERNLSIIRSNLMLKCLSVAEEENSTLDIRSTCCRWCLNPLSHQCCTVMLKPQKHPKKRLRSLLKRDKETLNHFQKKLVEKIASKAASMYLAFNCNFCSRTTLSAMKKPIVESKKDDVIFTDDHIRKKKKKRKDIYAGLNVAAVESVKNTSVNINNCAVRKKDKKLTVKEQSRMQRVLSQKVSVPKKKPGGLMVYEPRFTGELLASLLSIPPAKTLLRRHLLTHFKELLGRDVIQQKREAEASLGYIPLTTTAKIKVPKKSQFTLKRKKTKSELDYGELVCPLEGRNAADSSGEHTSPSPAGKTTSPGAVCREGEANGSVGSMTGTPSSERNTSV